MVRGLKHHLETPLLELRAGTVGVHHAALREVLPEHIIPEVAVPLRWVLCVTGVSKKPKVLRLDPEDHPSEFSVPPDGISAVVK